MRFHLWKSLSHVQVNIPYPRGVRSVTSYLATEVQASGTSLIPAYMNSFPACVGYLSVCMQVLSWVPIGWAAKKTHILQPTYFNESSIVHLLSLFLWNEQALGILNCNNVILNGLKIVNGSGKHISIVECIGVHISQLTITAPGDSPNTDGIHIERSQHVEILSSTIGTGTSLFHI